MRVEMKYVLGAAAGCALISALWLTPRALAFGADSPIIVRDGSIRIEDPGRGLGRWSRSGNSAVEHPDGTKALRVVEVTGPGSQGASCEGRGRCVVEMTWSTGQSIRIVSRRGGSRGLRIELSGASFDEAGWKKSDAEWVLDLPADRKSVV